MSEWGLVKTAEDEIENDIDTSWIQYLNTTDIEKGIRFELSPYEELLDQEFEVYFTLQDDN